MRILGSGFSSGWVRGTTWIVLATLSGLSARAEGPALIAAPIAAQASAAKPLDAFVAQPQPEFAWQVAGERELGGIKVLELTLTSQRWQDTLWRHTLMVFEPATLAVPDQMLLFITGGRTDRPPRDSDNAIGMGLAQFCGARVAVLHQVPNQPLMGERFEDDLITETWLRYLEQGDTTWPLLFPMVNSAVKAMDALEQLAAARDWSAPRGFVVAGASKRGWTSWLTAAADRRVTATAPLVIDMLNFPAQIKHQHALWGKPSEQIIDYTSKGLIPEDGVPRPGLETELWRMMDPYSYRDRVNVPKLLMVGANDRYWSTDAMNLYWDDLVGEKYIFRAANAGHGLEGSHQRALATLGAFFRHTAADKSLPVLDWQIHNGAERLGIEVTSDQPPLASRIWVAHSETTDFRASRWQPRAMQFQDDRWVGEEAIPADGHVAIFAELDFEHEGLRYALATLAYLR